MVQVDSKGIELGYLKKKTNSSKKWRKYLCVSCNKVISHNNKNTHINKIHHGQKIEMRELTESEYRKIKS